MVCCSPCLCCSIANSLDLVSQILGYTPNLPLALPSAISSLAKSARMTTWCSLEDIDVPLQQKSLSRLIDEVCFNTLVESAPDVRSRALALSSSLPHVGDWLNVTPSPALELCLLDQDFRLCLKYWLGVRMADDVSSCSACGKSAAADPFGDHHYATAHTIRICFREGVCSETGQEREMVAHNAECRGAGVSFVPLAVESLGGWSHDAALQISRIGRLVGQRLGTSPAEAVSHLFQRLSTCLWRENATMWAHRLPSHSWDHLDYIDSSLLRKSLLSLKLLCPSLVICMHMAFSYIIPHAL